ncbi:hypothetical protein CBR_g8267 [Chara braunii]|uniref:Uncharacterized protein n=1 Tax=Chara braunii TaxID=69332 RepID=A0A388KLQ5_CHABU|nr:hypothetical protein CBR_g8267 [Chara braunii]|eukprot:GBG70967.1 hypothetical protein CBR_g8267 [Chara braunii]
MPIWLRLSEPLQRPLGRCSKALCRGGKREVAECGLPGLQWRALGQTTSPQGGQARELREEKGVLGVKGSLLPFLLLRPLISCLLHLIGLHCRDRTPLQKMESALVHLHPKKLGDESISLPMSCMTRPPVDTPDGRRSREIREPGEYQVRVLMTSMERAPCGDHLPFVGMIDPSQCTSVDQVDKKKLREGGYTVWILSGGHSREARSRLMLKHATVDFYKRYTCYVYCGLTVKEAILVGHEHNRAAGFHKQLTFVQRMRCWRQTFEKLGCDKTLDVKKACLKAFGLKATCWDQVSNWDPQLQICMRGAEVWALMSDIFYLWEEAKIKDVKMKRGVGGKKVKSIHAADLSVGHEKKGGRPKRKQIDMCEQRLSLMTLNPGMYVTEKNEVVNEPADMPYKPWLMMAALDDAVVIPVLTEVKSGILSLDEMAEKFKILKTRQGTTTAFMKEVGVESWEKAKEEFPVHTQEAMLSQYYGLFDKNIKGTPHPMQLYAAKALNYRDKISQHEQHAAGTQDPEGLLADWVSFEGEGYKGSVKVMHCDMLQLSDKLEDRLPFTLCIFDFPCRYDADGSAHDAERFTKPLIEASVENLKKITCSPFWVLAGFCSTDMLSDVTSVFSAACNAGVEVGVWVALLLLVGSSSLTVGSTVFLAFTMTAELGNPCSFNSIMLTQG